MPLQARLVNLFVSTTGNDNNKGTKCSPLASLEAAIGRLEEFQEGVDVDITIGKGTYPISKPLLITPNKWMGKAHKLTIQGTGMGKTIISGGIELPHFTHTDNHRIWSLHLGKEYGYVTKIEQLYVGGHRAILARTPNNDYYFVPIKAQEKRIEENKALFEQEVFLREDDYNSISPAIMRPNNVRVSIFHYWDMSRRIVKSCNSERNSFFIDGASIKRWNYFTQKNTTQLYFENDISFLDTPGEYYYDSEEKILYYYPYEGESLEKTVAILPLSEGFLNITGSSNSVIQNITIKDLSLCYSDYKMPEGGEEPEQAVNSKSAAVVLDYVKGIGFLNVEISHTGSNAIWFKTSCKSSSMEKCYLHDLGAGGVKIGVTHYVKTDSPTLTKNITVNNCIITEGGRVLPPAVGVAVFKASDCYITHNEISDFYYTGISIGWVWGGEESPSKRNIVAYNHVHHLGWGGLSDMGGVYTLGCSEGTVINNNIIHDVYDYGSDGYGIYADEGTSGVLISNNVAYRCKSAGFMQHYGKDNRVVNNIFAYNKDAQLCVGSTEEKNSFAFEHNIVSSSKGKIFYNDKWSTFSGIKANSNIYWAGGNEKALNGKSLNEWVSETKKDENSFVVDPVICENINGYIEASNKEALNNINFIPIEYHKVGVYGRRRWRRKANMDKDRLILFEHLIKTGSFPKNE